MPTRTFARIAVIALAGVAAPSAAAAAAVVGPEPATYVGKTSQGKKLTVQFTRAGGHELVAFTTQVRGACRPGGGPTTTNVKSGATWTIAKGHWIINDKGTTYHLKLRGTYPGGTPQVLSGRLQASWKTGPHDARTCRTATLTWTVHKQ